MLISSLSAVLIFTLPLFMLGFPGGSVVKKKKKRSTCQCRKCKRHEFNPWVRKIPWGRKWQPTPVFLPRESHGQRSLSGYSLWRRKESDTTEQLSTYTHMETLTDSCQISSLF